MVGEAQRAAQAVLHAGGVQCIGLIIGVDELIAVAVHDTLDAAKPTDFLEDRNSCRLDGDKFVDLTEHPFQVLKGEIYGLNTECLLYDITNFYTFIREHEGNELPKKGNNKAKHFDLNQINLALLVTKEDGIPLMHHTYEGNRHDAKKSPEIIGKLEVRFAMFSKNVDKVTLVFDKGNNSKKNIELLDKTSYHFVESLKPYDFLEIPLEKFQREGNNKKEKDDI